MSLTLKIGPRLTVSVADYADASRAYAAARDESGEGASTFPFGDVICGGRKVARVSYNARVWGLDDALLLEAA
jgi:hypothetical protein